MTTTLELTERQQQVYDLLQQDVSARDIGTRLGVSRNNIYQVIARLKKMGVLSPDFKQSEQAGGVAPSEKLLLKLTQDDGNNDGGTEAGSDPGGGVPRPQAKSVQREENNASLSVELLNELARTQQELAKIANRLSRYL